MPDNDHVHPRKVIAGPHAPNPRAAYVELGVTTPFSFLRGASDATELALRAHELGYDALGVADLNTMAGVVRLHLAARAAALRPVIGCRLRLRTGEEFLAYPRDRAAYGRLCTLLSRGKMRDAEGNWQEKGLCDLTLADLAAHAEGVQLILVPGAGALRQLPFLVRRLPGLRHVAASWLYRGDDRARINRLARLARAHGLGLLATNDVHYHVPERRPLQDVMTCIREKTTIQRAGYLLDANAERHLKSPAEMERLFAEWPEAIRATRAVADACDFDLGRDLSYRYPGETIPAGETAQSQLAKLAWGGAALRYPGGVPDKVRQIIGKELDIIGRKEIAQYFLTIHEIVQFARDRGILCQGRGSAANSAVCFVLGITAVDPAEQEVFFERFISMDRDEPPDIDVDFEHERREEVIQHIYDKYGRQRAGLCATVIHYRPRSAIREVGKAMGLSEDVTGALANTVWGSWGTSMGEANSREAGVDHDDPLMQRTLRLAAQLIGMPRHLSQHVGGFVLTEGPLVETVPIGNAAMPERSFIEWDKDDIDALGILKVDVLALGMLTCIRKCFDIMRAHYGVNHDLASVPQGDGAVYDMLCQGDSVGVFQVESRAQMNMLPRLRPRVFYDLVIEVAIVRPGPIQGDMVHPYLRRRGGMEPVVYSAPAPPYPQDELEAILKRTLGVPIFQEQAMKIAMNAAEFSTSEANELRRAMATFRSRGTIHLLEEKMVGRMIARGYDPEFARRCFDQIKGFGDYGFPESHAASFALLVYVSAWLKHHYPAAFTTALLNSQPMGFYATAQLVRDAREHGVEVRPPDVNLSGWGSHLEPAGTGWAIRLGLNQIEGLGEETAAAILDARDVPYADLSALVARTGVQGRVVRALAAADAFGSMGLDRRAALWEAKALRDAPALPLFAAGREEGPEAAVRLPQMALSEQVVVDYQTLRLSLKAHPMSFLRASMTRQGFVRAVDLGRVGNGWRLRIAGVVLVRQRPGSAKGVCFITIEDETGVANLVVWPKVMAAFRKVIMTARLLQVAGRMQRDPVSGVIHVVAEELADRSDVLGRLADHPVALPLSRGDEVARPVRTPARGHPRDARIIPGSRDFH
jgi:error-prone DNA polymerase